MDFLDRLLQHVPDKGFRQVRYAGIYEGRRRKNLPQEWKAPTRPVTDQEPAPDESGDFWRYRLDTKKYGGHDPLWCKTCRQTMTLFAEVPATTRPKPTFAPGRAQRMDSS